MPKRKRTLDVAPKIFFDEMFIIFSSFWNQGRKLCVFSFFYIQLPIGQFVSNFQYSEKAILHWTDRIWKIDKRSEF